MFKFLGLLPLFAALAAGLPVSQKIQARDTCPTLALFFAAGTTERLGIVGGPLSEQLSQLVQNTETFAIDYNTDPEYVISVREGADTAANDMNSFNARCPQSYIAYSGYSKGAMVVRATTLMAETQAQVIGIAVFGDPDNKNAIQDQTPFPINNYEYIYKFCNDGDPICQTDGLNITAHLQYQNNGSTEKAAQDLAGALKEQTGI